MGLIGPRVTLDGVPANSIEIWEHFLVGSDAARCELLVNLD